MNPLDNKDKWAGQMSESKKSFIIGHFLFGNEFREWELLEQLADQLVEESVLRQYIFKNQNPKSNEMIRLDIIESPSWSKAHDVTSSLLNSFMSLDLVEARSKTNQIGDVGFMIPPEKPISLFFSRSNMAVRVVNMQKDLVSVDEVSAILDAQFLHKSATNKDDLLAAAITFGVNVDFGKVGEKIPLELKIAAPFDKEVWLKLTCETGEFSNIAEHVFYHPSEKGSHKIALHAMGREGRNHTIELTINVE